MSSSYRVLKLQSGEEIIAKIKGKEGEKVILENPMIFTTQVDSMMQREKIRQPEISKSLHQIQMKIMP